MADQIPALFLGGTCGNNPWRSDFTAQLVARGVPADKIFNPVVSDWNEAAQEKEEWAKTVVDILLFYIGSPMLEDSTLSAYSMVEATMGLYDKPHTCVVFDYTGIEGHSLKSMKQTEKVLRTRFPRAAIFGTAAEAIDYLVNALVPREPPQAPVEDKTTPLDVCGRCGKLWFEHTLEKEPPAIKDICEGFTKKKPVL